MPFVIETRNLTKHYRMGDVTVQALNAVTITVAAGEFVALVGTSGSGKSTLLSLIAGLDRPTNGDIKTFGENLATMSSMALSVYRRSRVGMIFQSFNLVTTMSAAENVSLAMLFAGVPKAVRNARARALLESMGLGGRQQHRPRELSGGEQQRVAVARALANEPALLLADEPTGNLDSRTAREIMNLLKGLNEREGKTIVLVTHDAQLAERYAHRSIALFDGAVVDSSGAPS